MKIITSLRRSITFCLLVATTSSIAQNKHEATCLDDAMLVFDGSSSMLEVGEGFQNSRIEDTRKAIGRAIPKISPFRKVGLIVYGPGNRASCANISVRFEPVTNAGQLLLNEIENIRPLGSTPLSSAVLKAAKTLHYKEKPGVIVLVTDGQETCGNSPCYIADKIAKEGLSLVIHVIGFRLKWDTIEGKSKKAQAFAKQHINTHCLPDKTGGQYVSTNTVEELTEALRKTLGCTVVS